MTTLTQNLTTQVELTGQTMIDINAPVEAVFTYMADFLQHTQWNKNLYKIWKTTPGPIRVGSHFKAAEGAPPASIGRQLRAIGQVMIGMLTGNKMFSEAEITALEPQRRIAWVGVFPRSQGEFNRAEWDVELIPHDAGTRVVQRFCYIPQTTVARQMLAALGDADGIAEACQVNLKLLKQRLERSNPIEHIR